VPVPARRRGPTCGPSIRPPSTLSWPNPSSKQRRIEQSKGRRPLHVQPHDAARVHAPRARALATAWFHALGQQRRSDWEDTRAMLLPCRTQATQTATPRHHLGRCAFLLHDCPLEQWGREQPKWWPLRASLCHPLRVTLHDEATKAATPRPPRQLLPGASQATMPSSSVLVLYSNGDGSNSIRESARSPCVHRNAFNESECVHHELTALLLIF
jgi:hypothetical protein